MKIKSKKILVISYIAKPKELYPKEIDSIVLCPNCNVFLRYFYHFMMLIHCDRILFFLLFKQIELDSYSIIIVNDTIYPMRLLKYIRYKNCKCRLIYWTWNTLFKGPSKIMYNSKKQFVNLLNGRQKCQYQIGSFDKRDCSVYGLSYINQIIPIIKFSEQYLIKYDILFVGLDKGRIDKVIEFKEKINKMKLNFKCLMFPNKHKKYNEAQKKILSFNSHFLDYSEIIKEDLQAKAILDIVQTGQHGLTWRPIEALIYEKKLITNFKEIKQYDFYNQNNIFIIGENNWADLPRFIEGKYEKIDEKIIKQYTFCGAINKFISNSNLQ